MKIEFGKLKIKNFLSFAEEEFDFSEHRKMALVCGKNLDLPGSKNGSGKCLDPSTRIRIEVDDEIVELFNKMKSEQ